MNEWISYLIVLGIGLAIGMEIGLSMGIARAQRVVNMIYNKKK